MNKSEYPRIGETLYTERLKSGASLLYVPKPGFKKSFAAVAVDYGSIDMRFKLGDTWQDTPAGVAHFLEHKMFDMSDGTNALQAYSVTGADPNAFTSNTITNYHFEGTTGFEQNFRILLDSVTSAYFTDESVEKEKGIIGQEIGMVNDTPNRRIFYELYGAMYNRHPIRHSIAGTVESIGQITPQTLYDCHKAFYSPKNMTICIVGDIDIDRAIDIADEMLPTDGWDISDRDYGDEPETVAVKYNEIRQSVALPLFAIGFKDKSVGKGRGYLYRELLAELALQCMMGPSSSLYLNMYKNGLVNNAFGFGFSSFSGGGCAEVMGESRDPKRVLDEIYTESRRVASSGFDAKHFDRVKKSIYGVFLRQFDSFFYLSYRLQTAMQNGACHMDFADIFDTLTSDEAAQFIKNLIKEEKTSLVVTNPI